jgi:hypothetical protein
MGAMPVGVTGGDAQAVVALASAEAQNPVAALAARLPIQRSRCAFAIGAWKGLRSALLPSLAKTASRACGSSLSRSWIRRRARRQQEPVSGRTPRPRHLPAQNHKVVAQGENLQRLRALAAAEQHDQLE